MSPLIEPKIKWLGIEAIQLMCGINKLLFIGTSSYISYVMLEIKSL